MSMLRACAAAGLVAALMAACGGGGDTENLSDAAETASDHTESANHWGHHADRGEVAATERAVQRAAVGVGRRCAHRRACATRPARQARAAVERQARSRRARGSRRRPRRRGRAACASATTCSRCSIDTASGMRDAIKLTNYPITGPMFTGPAADAVRLHDDPERGRPAAARRQRDAAGLPRVPMRRATSSATAATARSTPSSPTCIARTGNAWKPLPADGTRPGRHDAR